MATAGKIDRVLVQVKFVTYVPTDLRQARNGELNVHEKMEADIKIWAPMPIGIDGKIEPSLLKPAEQGSLWAQNWVAEQKYVNVSIGGVTHRMEVLAVTEAQAVGPLESTIVNQPARPADEQKRDELGLRNSRIIT